MHDRTLIAISLATSGLGIALLLVAYMLLSPEELGIGDAQSLADGEGLRIRGRVVSSSERGAVSIVVIEQPVRLDVIVFDPVNVTVGSCVVVDGKKGTFEGNVQVSASRIGSC